MITIYGMQDSGNCYKPRLLCALAGIAFRHVEVSMLDGGTKRPDFLAMNPVGQVPLLELEDGRRLAESDAILWHLGETTPFVPADPFEKSQMLQWMFFEQNGHEMHVAGRRSLLVYPERRASATPERLEVALQRGTSALAVMEAHLETRRFFVGETPSLADIALFAYTHVADEGGFDLDALPAVTAWLTRIVELPGFRPMSWLPEG
ncbi:glutathione S-transferase [Aureimonas sp. Leaf454]|uniref:glutathione S-transferase family protein n=1 Tax=Aureimonas sp. Leaf454 TaxID=1736381 RepID=UPI0006FF33D9|nr:glutathione S-transferase family protein [Aureimonas sp. Leaf454]KQT45266.1 glutathione S-transferase [Aureimonas sp. Leaf454]